ncbi:LuxR C-terminal-related transcriptional regulator [Microbacterium enclense]|uniref:helix-turn-helix transcriptional regulator n=1 Tax=Microbacterium enclense TaxID=993073 RepID=UPI003F7E42C5
MKMGSATAGPDARTLAVRALGGTSVLVAGPRGSGRSHVLRAVIGEIQRRGTRTIVVRAASILSAVPYGALDAAAHPALSTLRDENDDGEVVDGVLVVDDVELLDPATARAIARVVASRRLTAVLALRTARPRGLEPAGERDEVRRYFLDLGVEGLTERVDLADLTDDEGYAAIDGFADAALLDSATRAGLVWRADGSRALLHHLLRQAADDARAGRDPLAAPRTLTPHSPLAIALERHVAEFPLVDLKTLAAIRRLPRLDMAVATRLLEAESVHALVARGTLHSDASPQRRLSANDLIAHEAQRRVGGALIDALVHDAGRRMLAEADEWWSPPVAVALAQRWHRLGPETSGESDLSPALRARVALDAAREANDRGDTAHAAAHAARGRRAADTAPLRLEAQLAAEAASTSPAGDAADVRVRLRIARSLAECEGGESAGHSSHERALADTRVEELLAQAMREGAQLDWGAAAETAGRAVAEAAATPAARLRALVAAGTAEAVAGRWRHARTYYRGAERMLDARRTPEGIGARDRLSAVMFMLAGHQIAGADGTALRAALDRELATTAREGDSAELTLAGAAASIAFAGAGRAVESRRELESARSRTPSAVADIDVTMIELGVADELAMAGRLDEARAILGRLDDLGAPLLRRSRLYVQTTVLAAEGCRAAARNAARAAADLTRGRSAAALRIRDLFRLTALKAATDDEVDELVQLAATTDLPLAADAVRRASARSAAEQGLPVDELRLHALWSTTDADETPEQDAADDAPPPAARAEGWGGLTAREREIAMMAGAGLTNREIAGRLFLSVRTVESHIYQARTKVGAPSRRELGRMVAAGTSRDERWGEADLKRA